MFSFFRIVLIVGFAVFEQLAGQNAVTPPPERWPLDLLLGPCRAPSRYASS
ncbi:hypothetical protein [Xylella taiwanensis]|uniref:hypothetical protein n=1 Tax=Xylella taiwanensis TaxID=1444770 RepID=UPI00135F194A|nr:hypothetical protein [Xylella taiwanensis]MCD8457454.1 hypothetical protein [Xylella taiwanensis]MCD8461264.1 hypothetical protein [Xylella taiwanensis]MCD8462702.1 hypothetical protein [Xylella taiwanensis]UFN03764.1 hypothetical protein LPH41_07620 [Xylella taiwanensis]UFN11113.1 hypothetical protein LPH44_10550 [Xylella taiwanensis]